MESATLDLYERSIRTKRVPLSISDTFLFWLNPIAFFAYSIWYIYDFGYLKFLFPLYFGFGIYFFPLFLWSICALNIYTNLRDTKFHFLPCNVPLLEKEKIIFRLQAEQGWKLGGKSRQYIFFVKPITWRRFPTNVTIVWDENGYYVNCIDSRFRTVTFFSNPWEQVTDIIHELNYMSRKIK